ncbi:MAG: hypothetical protein QHI48_09810 [Bacteroidota bacterium]|nr:hypothetical protein [Bacteroidota bacterium]
MTEITCDNPELNALYPRLRGFIERNAVEYDIMGTCIRGYRTPDAPSIWIRDYSDMLRACRYWERDVKSVVTHFADMQSARGWVFDYVTMTPEKTPCERENWVKYVRVPVEADVEYRFVCAAYLAWQATGDDVWIRDLFPHLERALEYVRTDPLRWDRRTKLVKRAYTIDTWDFDWTNGRHDWLNFRITPHTYWGIMHGDNSGYYQAYRYLAHIARHIGYRGKARLWNRRAMDLRERANALCFNGKFYSHRIPLSPGEIPGVDPARQLSLSNPMDINRGMATPEMARAILREYRSRGRRTRAFAEWFSIDPPFPAGVFGDDRIVPGAYCNGGIMPLVGGELARAAFEHGEERYALRQLLRYEELTRNGTSYLWYFPDGTPASVETSTSPDASPADAWGASAMLSALVEGLAGVVDQDIMFRRVRLSPRWAATKCTEADVRIGYGPSGARIGYFYQHMKNRSWITLSIRAYSDVELRVLLPARASAATMERDNRSLRVTVCGAGGPSPYACTRFRSRGTSFVKVQYS